MKIQRRKSEEEDRTLIPPGEASRAGDYAFTGLKGKNRFEGQGTFQVRLFKPVDDEAGPIILQFLFAEQRAIELSLCV